MKLQTVINIQYTQVANSVVLMDGKHPNYMDGKYNSWLRVPPHIMQEYLLNKDDSRITYAAACKIN